MACQRFGITKIDQALDQPKRIVEFLCGFKSSLYPETYQRTGLATKIFLRKLKIRTVREPGIVDPNNPAVLVEEICDCTAIAHVPLNTQRQSFNSLKQKKC